MGLYEETHVNPVCRSENDTHPIVMTHILACADNGHCPHPIVTTHIPLHDFIKDDFIQEGDGQVASGSASLPDSGASETEEQRLEREQNEHDVLEALGDHKCDALLHTSSLLGWWGGW